VEFLNAVEMFREVVDSHECKYERKDVLGHFFEIGVESDKGIQKRFKRTNHSEAEYFGCAVDHMKQLVFLRAETFPPC
jgi:hypothetical protein